MNYPFKEKLHLVKSRNFFRMDVITLGDFSITNWNDKTCMSYRYPSLHEIDYRKSPKLKVPFMADATWRNDPCPFGSGKKYKRCHGQ
jgi:uncharacterized protein YecA (UPF0149 family)